MRASGQGIVQRVEQEVLLAMDTGHTAEPRKMRCGNAGRAWSQVYDTMAVRPWAAYPLRGGIANKKTVARTAHILLPKGCLSDRRSFAAA